MAQNTSGLRRNAFLIQYVCCTLLMPIPAAVAYFVGNTPLWWMFAVISAGLWALPIISHKAGPTTKSYAIALSLTGQTMLTTAAFSGHPWQIDSHMLFFAVLAIIASMRNLGVLVFSTVLIALHHATLSIALPALVYPDAGTTGSIGRTALHATILLIEFAVLAYSMVQMNAADAELDNQKDLADERARLAEAATETARQTSQSTDAAMTVFADHFRRLADGDLQCEIRQTMPEAYANLKADFNSTVTSLNQIVHEVAEVAHSIDAKAAHMNASAKTLATRTDKQASTLEQTAAALVQLTQTIETGEGMSAEIKKTVDQAESEAKQTTETVAGTVAAMGLIENSSKDIARIIAVIDDIAFQTNLLALNAGVEAARAGEAGAGFAVVAAEVRGLALRTAESATQIKGLVTESGAQVAEGVNLVHTAGEAIDRISQYVIDISMPVETMAQGAKAQSASVGDINTAIRELERDTQRNSELSEHSQDSSETLSAETKRLNKLIMHFKTLDNTPTRKSAA